MPQKQSSTSSFPLSIAIALAPFVVFSSCNNERPPTEFPVIVTPTNAKVDLSKVSLSISNATITRTPQNKYELNFIYTLDNQSAGTISFTSIYPGKNNLIEVRLNDRENTPLTLIKPPFADLTLAEPRSMLIPHGKSSRSYKIAIEPEIQSTNNPLTLRVFFHAPSRYDELRSTLKAPPITVLWPYSPPPNKSHQKSKSKDNDSLEDNPLTSVRSKATPSPAI